MSTIHSLVLDANNVVVMTAISNVLTEGAVKVSEEVYKKAVAGRSKYVGGVLSDYTPPPPPVVLPLNPIITDRQFGHGLWKKNIITHAEAKAFVASGTIPTVLQNLINALPTDQKLEAELLVAGATTFVRSHPFTNVLSAAFGWTLAQTDEFWDFCAALG